MILPTTTVGSWPRPRDLLRMQRQKRSGEISEADFDRAADAAVLDILQLQDEAGLDVITDGEQRRDNFFSFVAEKLDGVELMTLAEMLDVVEDKAGFERILQTLDVPAYAISNATCTGKIARRQPLAVDELRFLKQHTTKAVKVALPGPYLLTRAMYVPSVSSAAYPTKEDLGEDVVQVLREEIADLTAAGVDFIQFDEPVLTELVFTQGQTRTFMCAALAARKDPAEELEFAVYLMNRVLEGHDQPRIGVHVCRGNWSRDESTLLRGSYHPLKAYLERMDARQLVLEYATERAGDLLPFDKELGLGVVNPRTPTVEAVDDVKREIEAALAVYPPERLFLNPDCGFGTFSNRPVNERDVALAKCKVMADAAASFR
ncbi:MAG: cobalamin-independent methionine synthase II family protein [Chloroflexi bacterium]|nr:cobalamin-independent methionine synthase II family protein [Chloroflexota bacterium]